VYNNGKISSPLDHVLITSPQRWTIS